MRLIILATTVLTLSLVGIFAKLAMAGDVAGTGGDVVICGKPIDGTTGKQPPEGFYSYDYLQEYDTYDFLEFKTLNEAFAYIAQLLPTSYQDSFKEFSTSIDDLDADDRDEEKPGQPRTWNYSPRPLTPLYDESSARTLPPNCRSPKKLKDEEPEAEPTQPGTYQYYIRTPFPKAIVYEGSSYLHDKLLEGAKEAKNVIQLSMSYTHEWLWDFADKASQIRKVNAWLHASHRKVKKNANFVSKKLLKSKHAFALTADSYLNEDKSIKRLTSQPQVTVVGPGELIVEKKFKKLPGQILILSSSYSEDHWEFNTRGTASYAGTSDQRINFFSMFANYEQDYADGFMTIDDDVGVGDLVGSLHIRSANDGTFRRVSKDFPIMSLKQGEDRKTLEQKLYTDLPKQIREEVLKVAGLTHRNPVAQIIVDLRIKKADMTLTPLYPKIIVHLP